MEFLHPNILFALPVLSIPVIIHFFNFRKPQKVYFSNVSFLEEFVIDHRSYNRLQEYLIMILRILSLFFLLMAFAGLRFSSSGTQKADEHATKYIDIFLDNSQSMSLLGDYGSLLAEAQKKIISIIGPEAIERNSYKYALLTNDFMGSDFDFLSGSDLVQKVNSIKFSISHKTIPQIMARFKEINSGQRENLKSTLLFSDFQTNTYYGVGEDSINKFLVNYNQNQNSKTVLYFFNPKPQTNIFIDSVWNLSPIQRTGEINSIIVKVKRSSTGNSSLRDYSLPIKLSVNKKIKSISLVHFGKGQEVLDTLSFEIEKPGIQNIGVSLDDSPISFDNTFFASWEVPKSIPIYLIHGPRKSSNIKLVYQTDSLFNYQEASGEQVNYNTLSLQNFVILEGLTGLSSGLMLELKKVINRGGTLVYLPPGIDSSNDGQALVEAKRFLENFSLNLPIRWIKQDQSFELINQKNGFLKGVFDKIDRQPDLPKVYNYLQFDHRSKLPYQNLVKLLGGEPYLSEFNLGKGKIDVFSAPLFSAYTNLAEHPIFVPIFYKLALNSNSVFPLYYTLGRKELYLTHNWDSGLLTGAKFMGDSNQFIPSLNRNGVPNLEIGNGPSLAGFYTLNLASDARQGFAFNYDRSESILTYLSKSALEEVLKRSHKSNLIVPEFFSNSLREPFSGSILDDSKNGYLDTGFSFGVWKLCLILALLSLASEQFLIRKKSKPKRNEFINKVG